MSWLELTFHVLNSKERINISWGTGLSWHECAILDEEIHSKTWPKPLNFNSVTILINQPVQNF